MANAHDWREGSKVNLISLTNFIFTVIWPNLTSGHVKLVLVTPLGWKTRKLGAFGSCIPTYCLKPSQERNVFQSQNLHPWNTECIKSGALEPACCCFELKVTGFHLALVFTASLSEAENGVKPCRICKTLWSIQTKLIWCIEDFKVFAGNWTFVLCERNRSLSRKIFHWWI